MSTNSRDKKELLNRKSFCILPWMHLYAEPNGDIFPCCTATPLYDEENEDGSTGQRNDPTFARSNLRENTIEEAMNSPLFNQLRLDMLNGDELPSTCIRCKRFEDAGAGSYREFAKNRFNKYMYMVDNTNEDGSLSKLELKFLNVRFSNHCNMSCLTCGPSWSTTWHKHAWWIQRRGEPALQTLEDVAKGDLWQQVRAHLHTVQRIYFTGGEPMMMPDHWRILDFLINKGLAQEVELHYNSNMSITKFGKYDLWDMWSHFKHIDVGVSVDGVEEDAEIIRWGTKWNVVKENIKKLRSLPNAIYQLDSVVSLLNIYHLPKMQKYFLDEGMMDFHTPTVCNIAHEPLPLSITSIPAHYKKEIESYLLDQWERLPPPLKNRHARNGWFQVIEYMKARDTYKPGQLSEFVNNTLRFAKKKMLESESLLTQLYWLDNEHDRWFKEGRDMIGNDLEVYRLVDGMDYGTTKLIKDPRG